MLFINTGNLISKSVSLYKPVATRLFCIFAFIVYGLNSVYIFSIYIQSLPKRLPRANISKYLNIDHVTCIYSWVLVGLA